MTPAILAVAAVVAAAGGLVVVLAQPSRAWRDAAEHERRFWVGWDLAAVGLGAGGIVVLSLGWAGAAWITFWCVVGGLQPAMIADVRDVRRLRRRVGRVAPAAPPPEPALAPIRWHAPRLVAERGVDRLATAGARRVGP
jgi:hypothetical protein